MNVCIDKKHECMDENLDECINKYDDDDDDDDDDEEEEEEECIFSFLHLTSTSYRPSTVQKHNGPGP